MPVELFLDYAPWFQEEHGQEARVSVVRVGDWLASGHKSALAAAFTLSLLWGALGNGLISLFIAPPPSLEFPYQDVTHFGSLIFGTLPAMATWRALRRTPGRVRPTFWVLVVLVIVVISYATGKVRRPHLPAHVETAPVSAAAMSST
ncbi:MAG TPA: hypothetical protein VMT16_01385 [Thermoanaerobaculia bacterium]|nr:hypothetical protein [Thermoanaerobaculia bacterium]